MYRGDFAKKINAAFPDKTLYLVDTFDGFIESQLQSDESLRDKDYEQSKFKDTVVSKVLESMPLPNNCVPVKADICQPGIQVGFDCFSFASIDCDLYDPVYHALELFYPRLSKGGCIMVHDYNNPAYAGAMKAVDRYCQLHSLTFVPLADFCGSAVLVK